MSTNQFPLSRRTLLGAAPMLVGATTFPPAARSASLEPTSTATLTVTFYAELRVAPSFKSDFDAGTKAFAQAMRSQGALAVSLKQMVGDSTMVKNYPEDYKGLLRTAYADAAQAGTLPLFYNLMVRFDNIGALHGANPDQAFDRDVLPHLRGTMVKDGKVIPSSAPMAVYRGMFETTLAGNRNGIYTTHSDLVRFLGQPADARDDALVTVLNHVFVLQGRVAAFDQAIAPLLKVAQETYQPQDSTNGIGLPGSIDNRRYRKAVSTEILRKVDADGKLRAYLMHGLWVSVWDHENSHLDPRFKTAATPVGAMVEIGPFEPFYLTRLSVLRA